MKSMKRLILNYLSSCVALTMLSAIPAHANHIQPEALSGTYNCYYMFGMYVYPSELGKIQLDGQGTYYSSSYSGGRYVFYPSNNHVHFIDGPIAGLVAEYSVDNKGRTGIHFYIRNNPNAGWNVAQRCPNVNN